MNDKPITTTGSKLRLFAVCCARCVQHLVVDEHNLSVLDVAERHAKGEATDEELEAAYAKAKKIDIKDKQLYYADDAARYAAFQDPLLAAFFASENAEWAVANEFADRITQPDKWEAKKNEEWNIHNAALNKSVGRELRLFAVQCARRAQHLIKNRNSLNALNVAERHAKGMATDEELIKAYNEAVAATEQCELCDADKAAMIAAHESSLNAAIFGPNCAARALAFEVDDASVDTYKSLKWMTEFKKEEDTQNAMLKEILGRALHS